MSEDKLVEMMDMGDPKVEGCQKNHLSGREGGEDVKRHHEGAEGQFFRYGTLEVEAALVGGTPIKDPGF